MVTIRSVSHGAILLIASIVAAGIFVPAVHAGDPGGDLWIRNLVTVPDLNVTNGSFLNSSVPVKFQHTPEPITIFRFELNQTSLPGPRYMAYGPSVIGLSLDPVLLEGLIAGVVIVVACWYVFLNKRDDDI